MAHDDTQGAGSMQDVYLVGIVLLSLQYFLLVVSAYIFVRFRKVQPIKAHSPLLSLFTLVCLSIMILGHVFTFHRFNQTTCQVWEWLFLFGANMAALSYMLRCFFLKFDYQITIERIQFDRLGGDISSTNQEDIKRVGTAIVLSRPELVQQQQLSDPRLFWYSNHLYLRQKRFAITVILLSSLFVPIEKFTADAIRGDSHCTYANSYWIMLILFAGAILLTIAAIRAFREVVDGFWIKQELTYLIIFTGGSYMIGFILGVIREEYASLTLCFCAIGNINYCIIGAFYPYRLTKGRTMYPLPDSLASFDNFLKSRVARNSFKQFLMLEFSVENIIFYECVEKYANRFSAENMQANYELAKEIFDTFIAEGAVNQINVSHEVRFSITKQIDVALLDDKRRVPRDLFNAACSEVADLMRTDSFKRYRESAKCQDLARSFVVRPIRSGASNVSAGPTHSRVPSLQHSQSGMS